MNRRKYAKKIQDEQIATAHVFEEYINIFQNEQPTVKPFIKSNVLYSDTSNVELSDREIYNPKPLVQHVGHYERLTNINSFAKILPESKFTKSKKNDKPKSNLDLLKEELKQKYIERKEKRKFNSEINLYTPSTPQCYVDDTDPHSTNLFIANINPNIKESDLIDQFGVYGPLASVKIMWPRVKEDYKKPNCGFVAFMSRRDAERALSDFKFKSDFHIVWGKPIEIPLHPIYVPQEMLQLFLPPPQSGLPFNAQLQSNSNDYINNGAKSANC